ncbi:MAG: acetyl-CoA carboxylase biotin carboxyl carrier protein [Flavobacteriales bacterium]
MTLKEIQELIKFVSKSGATEVSLEMNDIKLTVKSENKKGKGANQVIETVVQQVPVSAMPVAQAPVAAPAPVAATPAAPKAEAEAEESKYVTIKSPIIGTFYRKPSPDKDAFASVGDSINAGDVVCIIEAMKLFNEIESEVSGKIVKVLVDDMSPIEYDQDLFLVDPS